MITQEIPQTRWTRFLDSLSRVHRGSIVTLQVLDESIGVQTEVRERALSGVFAEHSAGARISIVLGNEKWHLAHAVEQPTHLWLEQTNEGADQALEIDSADGRRTLLTFKHRILPEFLDPQVE